MRPLQHPVLFAPHAGACFARQTRRPCDSVHQARLACNGVLIYAYDEHPIYAGETRWHVISESASTFLQSRHWRAVLRRIALAIPPAIALITPMTITAQSCLIRTAGWKTMLGNRKKLPSGWRRRTM